MSVFEGGETQTAGAEGRAWEDAVARALDRKPERKPGATEMLDLLVSIASRVEAAIDVDGFTVNSRLARIEDRLGEVVAALDRVVERLAAASCAREDQSAALGSLALDDAERAADAPGLEWYARSSHVAKMGPFATPDDALNTLISKDKESCLIDAQVWSEVKP